MNKKVVVNFLQNLTLMTLTVTAILILVRFPMLDGVINRKMREILAAPESGVQRTVDLSGAITSVHLVVTDDTEFGRYTRINASSADADFLKVEPLLRGAIGSATARREATHTEFRAALETPGIYVDLTTALPVSIVAAWLGETFDGEDSIRAFALTTARETVMLFFLREDGTVMRCECALTSSAVREITSAFSQNGGQFAYESEYRELSPYTVLVQSLNDTTQMTAALPAGYSAYNLLTSLGLNAHTTSRYFESSGTEVVMQAPHFLWIGTDGTVHYSSDGEVTDQMYRISCAGDVPNAVEVLHSVYFLAAALSGGTDAAPLSLESVEQTETGWVVTFCYRLNGVRVRMGNERAALKVVTSGNKIKEFDYYCRTYTQMQESTSLLPPSMAAAIASMQDGAQLTLEYVDTGMGVYSAHWFAE